MKGFHTTLLIIVSLILCIPEFAVGQSGPDTLGWLSGGNHSTGSGISPEGTIVGGSANMVDSTGTNITVPLRWRPGSGIQVFDGLPNGDGSGQLLSVSGNGNFFCGISKNAQGRNEACRWSGPNSIASLGVLPNGTSSSAKVISNDGMAIAGTANNDSGQTAIYWTQAGGMIALGDLPGGSYYSIAEGMSGDGSTVVGWSFAADGPRAFRWSSGGGMVNMGVFPGYVGSVARDASQDGSVIVGSCTRNDSVGQTIQAFRWTAAGGMQGLGWLPGGQHSRSYHVSGDGKVIVGNASTATNPTSLFIWRENIGMMAFEDFLFNEHGIDIRDWLYFFINDISDDGTAFTGFGRDPNNRFLGWHIKLNSITINAPRVADRWVVGQRDTVRWRSSSVEYFSIDLSNDDGQNWQNIDFTTSPGDTMTTYRVPDSLVSSDRYRIRVSDLFDSTSFAVSEPFTVKGYDLTRVMPDGSLQNYDPAKHSWSYLNSGANMWPQSWWSQFDYANGDDPNTGERYPSDWTAAPVHARSQDMPDWPLFVEAFSEDQCYWSTFFASYKASAEEYWRTHKPGFIGSCYGFATSALLAFHYPADFLASNPGIPQVDSINALFLTNTIRKSINREWTKQYAAAVLENDLTGNSKTPRDLLHEVKVLFLDETRSGKAITMFNNNGSGAHTMLPFRLERDTSVGNLWRLFVYDSNNPNQSSGFIQIDSISDTWTDNTGNNYGSGSSRCYLEPSADLFLQTLTFDNETAKRSNHRLQIYTSVDYEVQIENGVGDMIGYRDSSDFGNMGDGFPIIPKTGYFSPPLGYSLPPGSYNAEIDNFSDSLATFSIFSDSAIYRYSRADAGLSQHDRLSIDRGLGIYNPDNMTKSIKLEAIMKADSSDRQMSVTGLQAASQDSLHLSVAGGSDLKLVNAGLDKQYHLSLIGAGTAGEARFENNGISLAANSSHRIAPQWGNLSDPAIIYIDLGDDGSIDDSLLVENQVTSIDGPGERGQGQIPSAFALEQNYPNPFNPETVIRYSLSADHFTTVQIYDVLGRQIRTLVQEQQPAGYYSVSWDGRNDAGDAVGSGVYYYRMQAGAFSRARKMLLVR